MKPQHPIPAASAPAGLTCAHCAEKITHSAPGAVFRGEALHYPACYRSKVWELICPSATASAQGLPNG